MRVEFNVSTKRFFSLFSAKISGKFDLSHSGGSFIEKTLMKKIIKSFQSNRLYGTLIINGQRSIISKN